MSELEDGEERRSRHDAAIVALMDSLQPDQANKISQYYSRRHELDSMEGYEVGERYTDALYICMTLSKNK